jgi:quercetin dioxygenase-like cupin family protein
MTLYSIVRELQMSLDDLLRVPGTRPPAPPPVIHDGERAPAVSDAVLHVEGRRTIDLGTGVRWERLTPLAETNADFLFVTYEVGSSSSWEPIAVRHAGREYGLVLSGRIRVALGLEEHELGPGDSIAFDTSQRHRIDNVGDEPATAVWCMVGPPRQEG